MLYCTQSSSKAGTLVCWGPGCLSACLLRRSASQLRASLACLASASSATFCLRLRSRSLSSPDCLASGCSAALRLWLWSHCPSTFSDLVPLFCVRDHAHTVYLAWPACCSSLAHWHWVRYIIVWTCIQIWILKDMCTNLKRMCNLPICSIQISGKWPQVNKHVCTYVTNTLPQCSPAHVGLAQARPNYLLYVKSLL